MLKVTNDMIRVARVLNIDPKAVGEQATLTIDMSLLSADSVVALIRALESAAEIADGRYDVEGSQELYDAASNAEFYSLLRTAQQV